MSLAAPQPLGGHLQLNGALEGGASDLLAPRRTGTRVTVNANVVLAASQSTSIAWAPMVCTMEPSSQEPAAAGSESASVAGAATEER